jgi:hypothetical protein
MEMTIAYSAFGSVGMARSATEGVCGNVEGRGILFDLLPPVENILASCFRGELIVTVDLEILETVPLTSLSQHKEVGQKMRSVQLMTETR